MNTLVTLSVVLNMAACGGVKTGRLLGFDGDAYNALFELNIDTGKGTLLHYFELSPSGGDLAVGPDGTLYASFVDSIDSLVIVDPNTGDVDIVGPLGFSLVAGLAFAPDGTLYGVDDATNQLITIDPLTGAGTVVGPTGVPSNQGLGCTFDGTMYLVGTPGLVSILYTVNLETGRATEVGPFGSSLKLSAAVEPIGATLYASAIDPFGPPSDVLVTLDPQTGTATIVGGFCPFEKDCPYMNGLAFVPGAGDADRDGDVDYEDFLFFQECFGPLDDPDKSPYCAFLDSDKDGDIDCDDWEAFIINWTEDSDAPTFDECDGCAGDANGDGEVDPLDAGYVLARFGCSVGTGDVECDAADQNGDGEVDPLDLGFVLSRFGPC